MKTDPLYTVGIIGYGVVGTGIHRLLDDYVVALYDPALQGKSKKKDFKDLDVAIICVPTPIWKDGMSCDTSIVEKTCVWLQEINFKGVVMIKSTTAPSELKRISKKYKLRIVFSPEFLGESKYYTPFWKYPDPEDMRTHMWQIFGGKKRDTEICVEIFKRKMSVDTRFYQTDLMTAALTKYIENCFFAMKVTFVNEWYSIAERYGVDWNELRELWLADPRINRNHTLVFPKDRGYGGKCFPKDVKALIRDSEKNGYSPRLMRTVDQINERFRGGD